jgi:hypothetical protein
MRKIVFISILFLSGMVFSQVGFYPIGAKWVYEIQPCVGNKYYDTIVVEKDTVVKGMTMRKLKYTNQNLSYLFLVSTSGVFLYDNDTLRMKFPLGININEYVNIDLQKAYYSSITGYSYKYIQVNAICSSITSINLNDKVISTYTLSIDFNSQPDTTLKKGSAYSQIKYNNVLGDISNKLIPPPINLIFPLCGWTILSYFDTDKYKYENNVWELVATTSFNSFTKLSNYHIEVFPNPSEVSFYIKFNSILEKGLEYKVIDELGIEVKNGLVENDFTLNLDNSNSGLYVLYITKNSELILTKIIILK